MRISTDGGQMTVRVADTVISALPQRAVDLIKELEAMLTGDDTGDKVYNILYGDGNDSAIVRWGKAEKHAWEALRLAASYGNTISAFYNANPENKAAVTAAFAECAAQAAELQVAVDKTPRYDQPIVDGMTITPRIFTEIGSTWYCILPILKYPPSVVLKAMSIITTADPVALKAELDALIQSLTGADGFTTPTNQNIINRSI